MIDAQNCSRCRVKFEESSPRKDATNPRDPNIQDCVNDFECRLRITEQVRLSAGKIPVPQQFEEIASMACGIICSNLEYIDGMKTLINTLSLSLADALTQEQEPT